MVQRLRVCLADAVDMRSIPAPGPKVLRAAGQLHVSSTALSPRPTPAEACVPRACALHQEKPPRCTPQRRVTPTHCKERKPTCSTTPAKEERERRRGRKEGRKKAVRDYLQGKQSEIGGASAGEAFVSCPGCWFPGCTPSVMTNSTIQL